MNFTDSAEQSLKNGDPFTALKLLQEQVRSQPADAKLRIFLFQLLAVLGQWERAIAQLEVAATLDPGSLAMAQMYGAALRGEVLREQVFAGKATPAVLGQPEQWLGLLIEALALSARGQQDEAEALRSQAYSMAPATRGSFNGQPFEWMADADMRLGPVLEVIIDGRYHWVPFSALTLVVCEAPENLRDLVWMTAHLRFTNKDETIGLIPTRYAGTAGTTDPALALARKTEWLEATPGVYHGVGQRVLTTDSDDVPLMNLRQLMLQDPDALAASAH